MRLPFGETLGNLAAAALRRLDAETAHEIAIAALEKGLVPAIDAPADPRLEVRSLGLAFPNPIGMAAGFDKNARIPDALLSLGFGFVEVGTITPKPQPGNPRPRLFRLPPEGAVINRLGFNNEGHAEALTRLRARRGRPGILGVNVGANKDAADRIADYVAGIERFAEVADYLTVNVSSPNTPGLRDLQARAALDELLARALAARDGVVPAVGRSVPVLLKIAPDLDEAGLDDVAAVALARRVDGLIVGNTTLSRTGVGGPVATEAGGLSGKPLFQRSTIVLAKMRQRVGRDLPIIGVGGITSGADAYAKIMAGATLVQLYTGLIYGGSATAARVGRELLQLVERTGRASVADLCGTHTAEWAARPLPA